MSAGAPLPTPARIAAALGGALPPRGAKIGLLGGSFNPAHAWHREISLAALRRLGLDEVWWLVSPQNPLKPVKGMAGLLDRLAGARAASRHRAIRVTALEDQLGTSYTAETLRQLTVRLPYVHFVWLMGADNLVQLTRWKDWQEIFHMVAVAVFDRPTYSFRACASKAARRFGPWRIPEGAAQGLANRPPPAWVFLHTRRNALSATAIRAGRRRVRGRVG